MRAVRATIVLTLLFRSLATLHAADPYAGIDPWWMLLHEPAVVAELKLDSEQQAAYQKVLDRLDLQFFPLRNKSAKEGAAGLAKIVAEAQQQLEQVLERDQSRRLNEILLRRVGALAFQKDDLPARLKLSEAQRGDIRKILDDVQKEVAAIEKEVSDGKPREPLEKKYGELKTDEQKQILEVLTPAQRNAWKESLGAAFDVAKLGQPAFKAPELVSTGEWINANRPLQLADARGKVLVVHFYASGCINCIHNYPTYRQWQDKFKNDDVVILGIHTPETTAEREVLGVRQKAAKEKFAFPVLIDGGSENWNAWGNSMWPSVYLVDKRGYVRTFWPGELKWKGATGDEFITGRIEALLAEGK